MAGSTALGVSDSLDFDGSERGRFVRLSVVLPELPRVPLPELVAEDDRPLPVPAVEGAAVEGAAVEGAAEGERPVDADAPAVAAEALAGSSACFWQLMSRNSTGMPARTWCDRNSASQLVSRTHPLDDA